MSRFDYPDPGQDAAYADGLAPHDTPAEDLRVFSLEDLLTLVLAACVRHRQHTLDRKAEGLLREWAKAGEYLTGRLGEYPASVCDQVATRAIAEAAGIGATRARLYATAQLESFFRIDPTIREELADAAWDVVADRLTREVIASYQHRLTNADGLDQSLKRIKDNAENTRNARK